MAIVTFNADVYPYCKGDVVKLSDAEKKRVDEVAKANNLKDVYSVAEAKKAETNTKAQK